MRENGRNSVRRPRIASLTDRNCEGFCRPGNRVGLMGLHGGGCRDRTDGHRSLASLQNEAARRGFSARNGLSQRMSKSLAGKLKALTMNRYLPVSLRFRASHTSIRAGSSIPTSGAIATSPFIGKLPFWNARFA